MRTNIGPTEKQREWHPWIWAFFAGLGLLFVYAIWFTPDQPKPPAAIDSAPRPPL
jgi:hypothetical protein